ncbi:MAG: hypothetical protein O7G85_08955 [Planctomycetota bacterium]|nr:hypothetical protein [Planctomycetota bacterium]
MTRTLDPLPIPSRREMTLAMSLLLLVGGYAVTRGGYPIIQSVEHQLVEVGGRNLDVDQTTEEKQSAFALALRDQHDDEDRPDPAMAGFSGFGD